MGGTLASLIIDGDFDIHASGLIGSFIGAVIVLVVWRGWRAVLSAIGGAGPWSICAPC